MIAHKKQFRSHAQKKAPTEWHAGFMSLLPQIKNYAEYAFRRLDPESREEAIQCCIVAAMFAYTQLVDQGKSDIAYAGPLAMYAIRRFRMGRRFGERMNANDVSSPYAQKKRGIKLESLARYDHEAEDWEELLVEDKHAGPSEVAAVRLDFAQWLSTLSDRKRHIAEFLAIGETTNDTAREFGVSAARISQLRREMQESWASFQGEELAEV